MSIRTTVCLLALSMVALLPQVGRAADKVYQNSVGMDLVLIPAGAFLLGSADGAAPDNEKPQHRVAMIGKPFYLGKYEVTQAQWQAVMGSSPYLETRSNDFYHQPGMAGRLNGPNNPATVSWNDAQEFIKRLNVKEGHGRYRLPSEAEWEYAARTGTGTAYSFGDDAADLGRFAWYGEDFASGSTHPVGQKAANPWELYDMHGNVWEWAQDWYGERYYADSPALDPGAANRLQARRSRRQLAPERDQLALGVSPTVRRRLSRNQHRISPRAGHRSQPMKSIVRLSNASVRRHDRQISQ